MFLRRTIALINLALTSVVAQCAIDRFCTSCTFIRRVRRRDYRSRLIPPPISGSEIILRILVLTENKQLKAIQQTLKKLSYRNGSEGSLSNPLLQKVSVRFCRASIHGAQPQKVLGRLGELSSRQPD
jgi:hypothetical protein